MKLKDFLKGITTRSQDQNGITTDQYGRPSTNTGGLAGLVNRITSAMNAGENAGEHYFPGGNGTNDGTTPLAAGRSVSRKATEARFRYGNEYGFGAINDNIFINGFDDPAALTFKVEFGEWGASLVDQSTCASIQRNSLDTNTNYLLNDLMPMGLLNLNFLDENSAADSFDHQTQYNAVNYLLNRNEDRRAQYARDFVEGLYTIQREYRYIFQKISGLDKLDDFGSDRGQRLKDCVIKLDCLPDGIDQKMRTLMQLYRKVVWDDHWQRWVLPDIYRYFKMIIYVFDKRTLRQRYGQENIAEDSFPIYAYECGPCEFVVSGLPDNEYTTDYSNTNTAAVSLSIKVHNVKTYMSNKMFQRIHYIKDILSSYDHKSFDDNGDKNSGQGFGWQFRWLQMMFMQNDEYYAYSEIGGSSSWLEHYPGDRSDYSQINLAPYIETPVDTWHYATVQDQAYVINSWNSLGNVIKNIVMSNTRLIRDSRQPDKYYFSNDMARLNPETFMYYADKNMVSLNIANLKRDMAAKAADMIKQLKNFKIYAADLPDQVYTEMDVDDTHAKMDFNKLNPDDSKLDKIVDPSLIESDVPDMPFGNLLVDDHKPDLDYTHLADPAELPDLPYVQLEPNLDKLDQILDPSLIVPQLPEQIYTQMEIDLSHPDMNIIQMLVDLNKPELAFVELAVNLDKARAAMVQLLVDLNKPELEYTQMVPNLEHMFHQFTEMVLCLDKRKEQFTEMIPDLEHRKQAFTEMLVDLEKVLLEYTQLDPNLEKPEQEYVLLDPNMNKPKLDYVQLMPNLEKAVMEYNRLIEDLEKAKMDFLQMNPDFEKLDMKMLQMYVDTSTGKMDFVKLVDNLYKMDVSTMTRLKEAEEPGHSDFIQMNPDLEKMDSSIQAAMVEPEKQPHANFIQMNSVLEKLDSSAMPAMIVDDKVEHSAFIQMNPDFGKPDSSIQAAMVEPEKQTHANFIQMNPDLEKLDSSAMPAMIVDDKVAHSDFIQMYADETHQPHAEFIRMNTDTSLRHSDFYQMMVDDNEPEHANLVEMITDTEVTHVDFTQMNPDETKPEHGDLVQMNIDTSTEHSDFIQMNPDETKPEHAEFIQMQPDLTEPEHAKFIQMGPDNTKPEHAEMIQMQPDTTKPEHAEMIQMQPDLSEPEHAKFIEMEIDTSVSHNEFIQLQPDDTKPEHAEMIQMHPDTEVSHSEFIRMDVSVDYSPAMSDVSLIDVEPLAEMKMIQMNPDDTEPEHARFQEMNIDTSVTHNYDMPHLIDEEHTPKMSDVKLVENERLDSSLFVKMNPDERKRNRQESESILSGTRMVISDKLKSKLENIAIIDPEGIKNASVETMVHLIDFLEDTVNEAKKEFKMASMNIAMNKKKKMEFPQIVDSDYKKKDHIETDMVAMERAEWQRQEYDKFHKGDKRRNNDD